jgi:hypothetical protein
MTTPTAPVFIPRFIPVLVLLALLAGCGGGEEPLEARRGIDPVRCEPHPGGGCA